MTATAWTPREKPRRANFVDLTGHRYGRLLVRDYAGMDCRGQSYWHCDCGCGAQTVASGHNMRSARVRSCGCLLSDFSIAKHTRHGAKAKGRRIPEYGSWSGMRDRCLNPADPAFAKYGGRGITVCERWAVFENFLADMGPRPGPDMSIDRIDNDGPYEPDNCRWATRKQQGRNRRTNLIVEFRGRQMTVAEAAELAGVNPGPVFKRLHCGWPVERAVTTPVRQRKTA